MTTKIRSAKPKRKVGGKNQKSANDAGNRPEGIDADLESILEYFHKLSRGTGYLPDYSTAKEEQNEFLEMIRAGGMHDHTEELSGAIGQIVHDVTSGLIRLRKIERHTSNPERKLAAGRALADLTSLFLDWWPKDAPKSVSSVILDLKKKSRGFQERWDEELHRKGRPTQRSRIDTICSYFIWEMHRCASDSEEFLIERFTNLDKPQKSQDEWGELVVQFVEKTGLAKRVRKDPARAAELLEAGKRRFVGDYWRIVVDPMGKRHWRAWAANHKFEQPISRLTKWMTAQEMMKKWPDWKPSYASVRRTMKQLLMEQLEPGTIREGWY